MNISAVLVTKGDVDLAPILESLPFDDIVVWDNSKEKDLKVYGRYVAMAKAKHDIIYTQDDDCIVDAAAVVAAYKSGIVVCNMPQSKRDEYKRLAPRAGLVGWGACFDFWLTEAAFRRYLKRNAVDDLFLRECDRVFTELSPLKFVDATFRHLEYAFAGRMGNDPRHLGDLAEITRRVNACD